MTKYITVIPLKINVNNVQIRLDRKEEEEDLHSRTPHSHSYTGPTKPQVHRSH